MERCLDEGSLERGPRTSSRPTRKHCFGEGLTSKQLEARDKAFKNSKWPLCNSTKDK